MAGRPRKPVSELELNGAFRKNPQRYTKLVNAPQAQGDLGDPLVYLKPREKSIWYELKQQLPPGVAGVSDRRMFALLCQLLAKSERGIGTKTGLSKGEGSLLMQVASKFGITPADRERLRIAPPPGKNEFAEFSEGSKPN